VMNYKGQGVGVKNYILSNNYVSGDKSKSFYSSDCENNTFLDVQGHILEEQSNSSNFFSNINNSNSLLYIDDSGFIMGPEKYGQYFGFPSTELKHRNLHQEPASTPQMSNFFGP